MCIFHSYCKSSRGIYHLLWVVVLKVICMAARLQGLLYKLLNFYYMYNYSGNTLEVSLGMKSPVTVPVSLQV